jgi:hypothetical protein
MVDLLQAAMLSIMISYPDYSVLGYPISTLFNPLSFEWILN